MSECFVSGRGQGHVSIVDLENFATASCRYTGDIHNLTVVDLFDTLPQLNFQLHTISLVRTCRISSFCTVAWQLARLLLTRRIARSLGDSGASCLQAGCPFCHPTSGVKALKAFIKNSTHYQPNLNSKINALSFRRVCCCQPVDADLAVHSQVDSYCTWAVVCQASQ